MKEKSKIGIYILYLTILLDTGGAYKRTSYILLIISLFFLCHKYKQGKLYTETKIERMAKSFILISGIASAFAGIDTHETCYGVIRLLAIFITGIAIRQIDEQEKVILLKGIPHMGIGLFLCSYFQNLSFFQNWISNTGRIAGTFEYPNTMAIFLLIGIVIAENLYQKGKWIFQVILSFGILVTGSRMGFVMMLGYYLFVFFRYRGRNKNFLIIFTLIVLSIFSAACIGISMAGMGRFLTININASTLQGRLLYWEDACRMLYKYPMGVGYMGYFYLQQLMQTGIYNVRFVHNEWLQLMLDYGIFAGIGTAMYFTDCFKTREIQSWKKEILLIIGIYSFFDFHLQYWSLILIVLLLLPNGEIMVVKTKKKYIISFSWIIIVVSGILLTRTEIADAYAQKGDFMCAVKWNPLSTEYKVQQMLKSSNLEEASKYTENILKNNLYVYPAYLINSNEAIREGQLQKFIENRKKAINLRKYNIEEYEEYFQILYDWYLAVDKKGEAESAQQCVQAMADIPEMIKEVKQNTSIRALKIKEKPKLYFADEYEKIIRELQRRR